MPDRELGGYTNANAMAGGGVSIREEAVILSPTTSTAASTVEQTFTLPGLLATDRIAYCTPGSTLPFTTQGTSGQVTVVSARTSAISIVAVAYSSIASSGTPATSITYVFGIAAQRIIP